MDVRAIKDMGVYVKEVHELLKEQVEIQKEILEALKVKRCDK